MLVGRCLGADACTCLHMQDPLQGRVVLSTPEATGPAHHEDTILLVADQPQRRARRACCRLSGVELRFEPGPQRPQCDVAIRRWAFGTWWLHYWSHQFNTTEGQAPMSSGMLVQRRFGAFGGHFGRGLEAHSPVCRRCNLAALWARSLPTQVVDQGDGSVTLGL